MIILIAFENIASKDPDLDLGMNSMMIVKQTI